MSNPLPIPPFVWSLSERGLGQRLIDLASLPFIAGEQPHARQAFFSDVDTIDPLTPQGATVERELVQDGGDRQRLVVGDGWRAHLVLVRRRPEVQVLVTAETATVADRVLDEIRRGVPAPQHDASQTRITMWTGGTGAGPSRYRRWMDAPRWETIARNYPGGVRDAIERVMVIDEPPAQGGRLLLWYGDPGTGKTTAIRSLAAEWQSWADVHFVLDPEAFFGAPDYLMHVVADDDFWDMRWTAGGLNGRWKILVVEDADELIRSDARKESGASLGRLLNLTDGILGHGLRVLLLITTNEPMRGLHPAVVRPGRCLADVQFRPFTRREASDWLDGVAAAPSGEVTLAELYRLRGDVDTIGHKPPPARRGNYL